MIKIKNNFDLKSTIFSGQCFRMIEEKGYYILVINDRVLKIKEEKEYYLISSNNEENLFDVVSEYFDLRRDYNKINDKLISKNNELKEIIKAVGNQKILRQDKFEMFISYIISQNNNVKKISNSINKLSMLFGEKVVFDNKEYYLFPKLEKMINLTKEDLKSCGLGFRDKYILNALEKLKEEKDYLEKINNLDSQSAMKELLKIKGIGPKVASCILMFGYNRLDVFPIDTWAKKYLKDKYNINNIKELQILLYNKYGEYVGLAIQHMFNYERNYSKSRPNS